MFKRSVVSGPSTSTIASPSRDDGLDAVLRDLPEPATIPEVAKAIRTTPAALRRAVQRGELKAFRTSRRGDQRLLRRDVTAYLTGNGSDRAASGTDDAPSPAPQAPAHAPWVLLDVPDVCKLTRKSRNTIWRWVLTGTFPPPDKVLPGGRKHWFAATVQNWLEHDGGVPV